MRSRLMSFAVIAVIFLGSTPITAGGARELIRQYFPKAPIMMHVAQCESSMLHYKDGKLHSSHTDDVGLFQINLKWNDADARARGLNLANIRDNVKMAHVLYRQSGLRPWKASRPCWGKYVTRNATYTIPSSDRKGDTRVSEKRNHIIEELF